jgi:4-aminobutyrate aminotransferase-like enzyme
LRALKQIKAPPLRIEARGKGLMAGIEIRTAGGAPATSLVNQVIQKMLHKGFILLPEGEHANVIALTPPLTITKRNLARAVANLKRVIIECASIP